VKNLVPLRYYERTVNYSDYNSSIRTFSIFHKIDRYFYAQFYWLPSVIKPKAKDNLPLPHRFIFYKNINFYKYYIILFQDSIGGQKWR